MAPCFQCVNQICGFGNRRDRLTQWLPYPSRMGQGLMKPNFICVTITNGSLFKYGATRSRPIPTRSIVEKSTCHEINSHMINWYFSCMLFGASPIQVMSIEIFCSYVYICRPSFCTYLSSISTICNISFSGVFKRSEGKALNRSRAKTSDNIEEERSKLIEQNTRKVC